jgi:tetrahydromethanopterin S-methyltransferase subunit F
MAYLVLKGEGFWRKRQSLVFRDVRVVRVLGLRRVLRSERYIQKKAVIVLEGGAGTGKTRELLKVYSASDKVFGAEGVYIACGESLENWFKRAGLSSEELKGLRQFEKIEKMVEKLKGKVVCLDDVDKVDSKVKISAVKWIVRVAKVVVLSCAKLKNINPSIVEELRKKLRLKAWESLETLDLGGSQSEIKDIGMVVAIVMVVVLALAWGLSSALLSALALRWLVNEGKRA